MRLQVLIIVFIVAIGYSCTAAEAAGPKEKTGLKNSSLETDSRVGKQVPAFKGLTTAGVEVDSREFGDGVLIIDLWGLNCGSCLDEMKALEQIYQQFQGQGLRIWAVNTEDIGAEKIRKGLAARNLEFSFELLVDPGLEISKNFTSWFIPVTVIVDSTGVVQYYKIGFNMADAGKIKAKVGALLAQ